MKFWKELNSPLVFLGNEMFKMSLSFWNSVSESLNNSVFSFKQQINK